MNTSGDFTILWSGDGLDNDGGLYTRRYMANGQPKDLVENLINEIPGQILGNGKVAMDNAGGYVATWDTVGRARDVVFRRFGSDGNPLGSEVIANTFTRLGQFNPAIAMYPGGDFIIVWRSAHLSCSECTNGPIMARRFNASGNPVDAVEFQVSESFGDRPNITLRPDGGFIVTWDSGGRGTITVHARIYNADGKSITAPLKISKDDNSNNRVTRRNVDAVAHKNNYTTVIWTSSTNVGGNFIHKNHRRQLNEKGNLVSEERPLNPNGNIDRPTVSAIGDGFIGIWEVFRERNINGIAGRFLK